MDEFFSFKDPILEGSDVTEPVSKVSKQWALSGAKQD